MDIVETANFIYKILPEEYHLPDYKWNKISSGRAEINTYAPTEWLDFIQSAVTILGIPFHISYSGWNSKEPSAAFVMHLVEDVVHIEIWLRKENSDNDSAGN